jgi:sigma-B regulation protein RsbU (phosphoserine phosphatase)
MTLAMSASAIYAREADTPSEVLRKLDDALSDELSSTDMYLTAFYGVIDAAAGVLTYANAGHAHAFVVRADGRMERLHATDPPVGFAGPDSYRLESTPWHSPDDLLVLFTDGLPDGISAKDRVASERLLLDAVARNRRRAAREFIEALFEVSPKGEPSPVGDDRTALVVRR